MPGKTGSFAAYLEYTQRNQATPALSRQASFKREEPVDLLRLLSLQPEGSMSVESLARASGRSAALFFEELKSSSKAGLIQVQGPPLEETVIVTPKGRELATLASR